jgi:basic amino acid/polyamine antiporter, APA family
VPHLLRRLGTRDAALIVMGGIIGSGIFMNPSVVAALVHRGWLMMLAWVLGGLVALLGAGIFADLAERRPNDGGLYAYMSDAFHPSIAFVYGWTLLLVSQSGGAAASAITFAAYFEPLTGLTIPRQGLAVAVLALFTIVNCLGVRQGASTQNVFMVLKIAAIGGIIAVGLFAPHATVAAASAMPLPDGNAFALLGLAMVPVLFAYSGWQTSSFMSAELREPAKTLPRGLIYGVLGVVVLYLAVNAICLRVLGPAGLAATTTPASAVAQIAFGPIGERIMAAIVALSTLGFISNQILTSPRVYFQMAADGSFFKQLAWISPRTNAPVIAIGLQGAVAIAITFIPSYGKILNYVTSVDYVIFGLSAIALVIFHNRDRRDAAAPRPAFSMPGHPWSTLLFLVIAWGVVADVAISNPMDSLGGLGIMLSGLPVFFLWKRFSRKALSS